MSHSTLFISYKRLYCVLREMDLDEEHPHVRHYQYFLASFDLLNYVHQPTRYGQTKRSCLDLLLIDEASLVHSCTPVPSTMETDHELVIADLLIAQPPSPPPVQPPYRNIKNTNVSLFCNDLENQSLATFSNGKIVDSMWLEWIEKFNEVSDRHAPLRSPQGSHRKVQRRTRCDCPWMTPELRLLIRQKLKAHRHLTKDPSNSSLFSDEMQQSYPELSLKNRHFMDMSNEHSKSPRKLWSLLNSLTSTGRVKSHPPPRATLISPSETFAAIVSDPSRPVHLVQTAETETRCTSEPSQERRRLCQFSPVSVQMVQNIFQNISSRKATGADGKPFAKELCPELGTIPYSNFHCLIHCRRTATGVQTGRHYPCISPEIGKQPATIDPFLSFPS